MQAEILSVGTEVLLGEILDTNAQYISSRLKDVGVDVYRRVTVGDNRKRLKECFEEALSRANIVIATGGLGPTDDDITAECLASATGRTISFNGDAWEKMLNWFSRRSRQPGDIERKQACIIDGGSFFPNNNGTAPGQYIFVDGKLCVILPGPPREMKPMFENWVIPLIKKTFPNLIPLFSTSLKLVGLPEAEVGEAVRDLMENSNPTLAPYAGFWEVRLRIAARGKSVEDSKKLVAGMELKVRERLNDYIYGRDDETLENCCGNLLKKKGLTLSVAESVTGGLLSHRFTNCPGSSAWFKMGMVSYSPQIKFSCLGVDGQALSRDESVNEEVALSMARGVRLLAGSHVALSTTGFAGPGGGTPSEPIGTVYIGLSTKKQCLYWKNRYPGTREATKQVACQRALQFLWKHLKQE